MVVVDEAHRLRNVNSKLLECLKTAVTKGLVAYGYQHRVLMTGKTIALAAVCIVLLLIIYRSSPNRLSFTVRFAVQELRCKITPQSYGRYSIL